MLAINGFPLTEGQLRKAYKDQGSVKRGFCFLKNGDFQLTPVFLKKPNRIQAFSFVMCFSLMTYAINENQLSTSLAKPNETIHIQETCPVEYKDNAKSILMKVFTLFDNLGTTSVTMAEGNEMFFPSSRGKERTVLFRISIREGF